MPIMFWARVHFGPTCWEWIGPRNRDGYGLFPHSDGRPGSNGAHRAAWVFENGPIPPGLCVLHRCDNPRCVRVDHLFLGTQTDNMADRTAKGRTTSGKDHWYGKRTHCKHGHPFDADNSFKNAHGTRVCRACRQRKEKAKRERRKVRSLGDRSRRSEVPA